MIAESTPEITGEASVLCGPAHHLWVMHHSLDPDRKMLAVTCYLDESATDGGTQTAVVGGLLLTANDYVGLNHHWNVMLDDLGLRPALHMKDFGKHGRFASLSAVERNRIFGRATQIIADHRIYSLSATLEHGDYLAAFSNETRDTHSVYELCFIIAAIANGKIARQNHFEEPIAFVVDAGNARADQVLLAHREMQSISKQHGLPSNLGSLTFGDDEIITALQAADVVCWGARRKATHTPFLPGMGSIEELITSDDHRSIPFERTAAEALEASFLARRTQDLP
jgi:hypothetical protein